MDISYREVGTPSEPYKSGTDFNFLWSDPSCTPGATYSYRSFTAKGPKRSDYSDVVSLTTPVPRWKVETFVKFSDVGHINGATFGLLAYLSNKIVY